MRPRRRARTEGVGATPTPTQQQRQRQSATASTCVVVGDDALLAAVLRALSLLFSSAPRQHCALTQMLDARIDPQEARFCMFVSKKISELDFCSRTMTATTTRNKKMFVCFLFFNHVPRVFQRHSRFSDHRCNPRRVTGKQRNSSRTRWVEKTKATESRKPRGSDLFFLPFFFKLCPRFFLPLSFQNEKTKISRPTGNREGERERNHSSPRSQPRFTRDAPSCYISRN